MFIKDGVCTHLAVKKICQSFFFQVENFYDEPLSSSPKGRYHRWKVETRFVLIRRPSRLKKLFVSHVSFCLLCVSFPFIFYGLSFRFSCRLSPKKITFLYILVRFSICFFAFFTLNSPYIISSYFIAIRGHSKTVFKGHFRIM